MSKSYKIVDKVTWLFNLLTFLVATIELYELCHAFYKDREMSKGVGDIFFVTVLLDFSAGIVWTTGRWLFSKPGQIFVPGLLVFWVFLIYSLCVLAVSGMGAGPGAGE